MLCTALVACLRSQHTLLQIQWVPCQLILSCPPASDQCQHARAQQQFQISLPQSCRPSHWGILGICYTLHAISARSRCLMANSLLSNGQCVGVTTLPMSQRHASTPISDRLPPLEMQLDLQQQIRMLIFHLLRAFVRPNKTVSDPWKTNMASLLARLDVQLHASGWLACCLVSWKHQQTIRFAFTRYQQSVKSPFISSDLACAIALPHSSLRRLMALSHPPSGQ